MAYFRCTTGGSGKGNTLVVTCADELAGATITCTNGTKTYTKTCPSTAPYEVTFYGLAAGTWTVSATVSGNTYTTTVVITDYEAELGGFNWKAWVDLSENYTSSDFTDLDELLDTELAVRELMTIHACVDYLADIATTSADVETIIGNDICAKWINNRDYALDTLYANEIIAGYMDTADKYGYGEWCLMPQVPIMTSNTTPSGESSADSDASGYEAYKAFDGNDSTYWNAQKAQSYIQYDFGRDVCVRKITYMGYAIDNTIYEYVLCGIDGNGIEHEVQSGSFQNVATLQTINVTNSKAYPKWRLKEISMYGVGIVYANAKTLQFYAYAPKGNVPIMTANNAPYGVASASAAVSGREAYKAFDGSLDDVGWNASTVNNYVAYTFTNPVCVKRVDVMPGGAATGSRIRAFEIRGSNDNFSTYETLYTDEIPNEIGNPTIHTYTFGNNKYFKAYSLYVSSSWEDGGSSSATVGARYLQFYGRELSVSVPKMTSNTAPYGEAIENNHYDQYAPYKAFDGNYSTYQYSWSWYRSGGGIYPAYVGYDFKRSVVIKHVVGWLRGDSSSTYAPTEFKIQGLVNNEWVDISEVITNSVTTQGARFVDQDINANNIACTAARLYITNGASQVQIMVQELKFYGEDYSEKEFEQGTTKKWLYDHGVELESLTVYNSNSNAKSEKRLDDLYLYKTATSNTDSRIYTSNTVDLTDYSLLRMCMEHDIYIQDEGTSYMAVSSAETGSSFSGDAYVDLYGKTATPYEIGLDISSVINQHYIRLSVININAACLAYFACTELWLE